MSCEVVWGAWRVWVVNPPALSCVVAKLLVEGFSEMPLHCDGSLVSLAVYTQIQGAAAVRMPIYGTPFCFFKSTDYFDPAQILPIFINNNSFDLSVFMNNNCFGFCRFSRIIIVLVFVDVICVRCRYFYFILLVIFCGSSLKLFLVELPCRKSRCGIGQLWLLGIFD